MKSLKRDGKPSKDGDEKNYHLNIDKLMTEMTEMT